MPDTVECHKEGQNVCQKECQIECHYIYIYIHMFNNIQYMYISADPSHLQGERVQGKVVLRRLWRPSSMSDHLSGACHWLFSGIKQR